MPDFNDLADRLLTDMSQADWRDADLIRAEGSRRGRARLAMTAATVAVVAVVAVVLLANAAFPRGAGPAVPPAASPSVAASPSGTTGSSAPPSPSAPPSLAAGPPQGAIPPGALLTAADVRPAFTGLDSPYAQPGTPNPFLTCGPDGLPGGQQFTDAVGVRFTGGTALLGFESIMRFPPGAAHQTMAAISQLTAGDCAGPFQVLRRDLGGDESMLITSSDGSTVVPQFAHGVAIYYAVERRGDYLVWVTLVDEAQKTGQASLAATLATRAAQRACAAVTC